MNLRHYFNQKKETKYSGRILPKKVASLVERMVEDCNGIIGGENLVYAATLDAVETNNGDYGSTRDIGERMIEIAGKLLRGRVAHFNLGVNDKYGDSIRYKVKMNDDLIGLLHGLGYSIRALATEKPIKKK